MSLLDNATTAADLRKAATVIKLNGWTQGVLFQRFENLPPALSPCCAVGALGAAVSGDPIGPWGVMATRPVTFEESWNQGRRIVAARNALGLHLGLPGHGIPYWNDTPGRTRAEVIAAFEAAADALEASNNGEAK